MLILWLFLFIGVIQCDDKSNNVVISPNEFDSLSVPCPVECILSHTLSVQSAYITTVESMLTSGTYIKSGFPEIDDSSDSTTDASKYDDTVKGFDEMINSFKIDNECETKNKLHAVVYMTTNYYYKRNESVKNPNKPLSEAKDVNCAQSCLYARKCESSYNEFIESTITLKTNTAQSVQGVDYNSREGWATYSKLYYETKQEMAKNTGVFLANRDAFLFSNGINLCKDTPKIDEKLLDIYNSKNLSLFFNIDNNDAMDLFCKTTDHMYSTFKASLTAIYLNSACSTSKESTAMRSMEWEQVNLVRANYEFMCEKIVAFILCIQNNAKSKFGENSDDYNKIMQSMLYISVERMLLEVIQSTEVSYRRALKFNMDGSMLVTPSSDNQYNMTPINMYYEELIWRTSKLGAYDLRIVVQNNTSYPTSELCIPQNMYSLIVNRLFFQTIIIQVNDVFIQIRIALSDDCDATSWITRLIQVIELENSITFAKCSATVNKISSLNMATYAYIVLTTCQNSKPTDIVPFMDQTNTEVIEIISVHSVCLLYTFNSVFAYISNNAKENITPMEYKPKDYSSGRSVPIISTSTGSNPGYSGGNPSSTISTPTVSNPVYSDSYPILSISTPTGYNPGYSGSNPSPTISTPTGYNSGYSGSNPSSTISTPTVSNPVYSGSYPNQPISSPTVSNPGYSGSNIIPPISYSKSDNNNNYQYTYVVIVSDEDVKKTLEYFQTSVTIQFSSSIDNLQSLNKTEEIQLVLIGLECSQQQFKCNYDYLDSIASKTINYITENIPKDTDEYYNALNSVFKDTNEKKATLSSMNEIPFKRSIRALSGSSGYTCEKQYVVYTEYIIGVFNFFGINYNDILNTEKNADAYVNNCITKLVQINDGVVKDLKNLKEDAYTTYLLWTLSETLKVFNETCTIFKTQICQSNPIIAKMNENSQDALYLEITQRMESALVLYSAPFIKCHEYIKNSGTVTIYVSEFEIISTQITIIQYSSSSEYKEITVPASSVGT